MQNVLPQYITPRPVREILLDYLKNSGIGSVHEFMRGFTGLLKAGVFSNENELQREYMQLGKDYTELKNLIDWMGSQSEEQATDTNPAQLPGLTQEERDVVLKLGKWQKIKRGTRLIREGEKGHHIFFLMRGGVDLYRKTPDKQREHICHLGSGHVFGEYGAFLDLERTADVVATKDSEIFVINALDLKNASVTEGNVYEILKERVFLFKNLRTETGLEPLPIPVLRKFFDNGELLSLNRDDTVFLQGDWGDSVYFIMDGDVHILRDGTIRRTLKRGDFFGEIALLKKSRRSASAQTASPAVLLKVDHLHFLTILAQNISIALKVENIIKDRLKRF